MNRPEAPSFPKITPRSNTPLPRGGTSSILAVLDSFLGPIPEEMDEGPLDELAPTPVGLYKAVSVKDRHTLRRYLLYKDRFPESFSADENRASFFHQASRCYPNPRKETVNTQRCLMRFHDT